MAYLIEIVLRVGFNSHNISLSQADMLTTIPRITLAKLLAIMFIYFKCCGCNSYSLCSVPNKKVVFTKVVMGLS